MVWVLFVGLMLFQEGAAGDTSCETCHAEFEGTPLGDPVAAFKGDVHREAGLSCASCHGGDPTSEDMDEAKDPAKGFIGAPDFADISELCGSCHSSAEFMKQYQPDQRIDQLAEYRSSGHGRAAARGDQRVATCTSCHSVHGIQRVNVATSPVYPLNVADTCGSCHSDLDRMEPYDLPRGQVSRYRSSVHARALYERLDLSAPTCNDCHGNHGAVQPGVASVTNICGNCHGTQRDRFETSPHFKVFESMDLKGCVTCHGNHDVRNADEELLAGPSSVCYECHDSDTGTRTAQEVAAEILELRERIDAAEQSLALAEQAGMEVSQPIYDLREGQEQVILARHEVHSLDREMITMIVEEGLRIANQSYDQGAAAFEDLGFRKTGLYLSLGVIVAVIAALMLWIKEIEKEE